MQGESSLKINLQVRCRWYRWSRRTDGCGDRMAVRAYSLCRTADATAD